MKCIYCSADMSLKSKTYVANLEKCVIIIKNVPAYICEQCGEVYYTDEVVEKIEQIISKLENIIKEVAVVEYTSVA